MKIKMIIILIAISAILTSGFPGEYRFYIKDASSDNYYIKVVRYDNNEPIFGINKMMIEGTNYDEVISDTIDYADDSIPAGFHYYLGFDLLSDEGSYRWPFIAEGKYEFQIYRDSIIVMKFKMDLRQSTETPDINFEYTYPNNSIIAKDQIELTIYNNQEVNSWTLHDENRDWSFYYNEVELKNSINYTGTYLKLESADNGFPETSYSIGTEFSTGTVVELWRGAYYEFSVKNTEVTSGGNTYKFRNWFNTDNYETSNLFKVGSDQTKFESVFNQIQPLTVTNNLEGGSGGTYTLTWSITDETTDPISSGVSYNAFDGTELTDRYSIHTNSSISSVYGQDWTFLEWSDGITSTTRSNEQITSSNKNFIANFKSWNRTENSSTYSTNGQRRIGKTYNAVHKVYESFGKVWYEKSSDNGSTWTIMNNGVPISTGTASASTIAVHGLNEIIIGFVEGNNTKLLFLDNSNSYSSALYTYQVSGVSGTIALGWETSGQIILINTSSTGLQYWFGFASGNGITSYNLTGTVSNTNSSSNYPAMVAESYSGDLTYHLVWQQGTSIKYTKLIANVSPASVSFSGYYDVSTALGYSNNANPSIADYVDDGFIVSWITENPYTYIKVGALRSYTEATGMEPPIPMPGAEMMLFQ